MQDEIHLEKAGVLTATICTDRFKSTDRAMASMWEAPDYPIIYTPHPIGGLDRDDIKHRAESLLDQGVAVLTGVEVSQLAPVQ